MHRRNFMSVIMTALVTMGLVSSSSTESSMTDESLMIWTTAEGRRVRIRDMDDAHLRNCIFYHHKMQIMMGYPAYGKAPNDYPNVFVAYDIMRREANRRKLTWI